MEFLVSTFNSFDSDLNLFQNNFFLFTIVEKIKVTKLKIKITYFLNKNKSNIYHSSHKIFGLFTIKMKVLSDLILKITSYYLLFEIKEY